MKGWVVAGVAVLIVAIVAMVGAVSVSHMPVTVTLSSSVCKSNARTTASSLLEPGDYPCQFEAYVNDANGGGVVVWGLTGTAAGQCLLIKRSWVRSIGVHPAWHAPMLSLPRRCAANFAVYKPRHPWINWSMVRGAFG